VPSSEISQRHALILDAVHRLLGRGAMRHLGRMVNKMHPAEVAKVVRHMDDPAEKRTVMELLERVEDRAEVLCELDEDSAVPIFTELPRTEQIDLLRNLSTDDAADLLGALPPELSAELIERLPRTEGDEFMELLRYPEETAGGIMTPDVFAAPTTSTAREVIARLQGAPDAEMVFYVYVVDADGVLKGVLSLRELLTMPPDTPLEEVMVTPVVRARVDMDQEAVARMTARYNLLAVPVVDHDEKLVGIITVDDVIDVIRDEATEDMLKLSGTGVDQEYSLSVGTLRATRLRLPWLMANVLGGLVTAWVMTRFTHTLQSALALVAFVPVCMALGGSLGLQSATIVVRGLATGQIEPGDLRRVFFREVRVGAMIGIVCGLLVGAAATLWRDPWVGTVVATSLVMSSCVAVTIGTLTPILFQRLRLDPAVTSGPLVTTLNDVTGLTVYLAVATLMLVYLAPGAGG